MWGDGPNECVRTRTPRANASARVRTGAVVRWHGGVGANALWRGARVKKYKARSEVRRSAVERSAKIARNNKPIPWCAGQVHKKQKQKGARTGTGEWGAVVQNAELESGEGEGYVSRDVAIGSVRGNSSESVGERSALQ